jgi:6-pyruvoyltetrahydropterin/6-carboxytetrahydropterin synthase
MLQITKIFRFEMAHAVFGYPGKCKNIHGHSYELHVTVGSPAAIEFVPAPGFILDFKVLKAIVQEKVIDNVDHKLVLSSAYINDHQYLANSENLCTWPYEPTAENILLYVKNQLNESLPNGVYLMRLKLYETNDSYAEWINTNASLMH